MKKRGELTWDTLIPWIIGFVILIIVIIIYMFLSGRAEGAIQYLKNLLRFGT